MTRRRQLLITFVATPVCAGVAALLIAMLVLAPLSVPIWGDAVFGIVLGAGATRLSNHFTGWPRHPDDVASQRKRFEQLMDQLSEILIAGTDGPGGWGGYSASADAMWKAAALVFNFAARAVGATGFQAQFAALQFYGDVMAIDGPFIMLDLSRQLYPQSDLRARLDKFLAEQAGWLRDRAAELLAADHEFVHPDVEAHWRQLAKGSGG